jgi:hypothetical protein
MPSTGDDLQRLEDVLLGRSFLFDHPKAYRAGVTATIEAVRRRVSYPLKAPGAHPESPYAAMLDGRPSEANGLHPKRDITAREMKLLAVVC